MRASLLALTLIGLVGPAVAQDIPVFRSFLSAPLLFTGQDTVRIAEVPDTAWRDGKEVSIAVRIAGRGEPVLVGAPDGWRWDAERSAIVGTASSTGDVEFSIEVRRDGELMAEQPVSVSFLGALSANVSPASTRLETGEEFEIVAEARNLTGTPVWSFADPELDLPDWVDFDGETGTLSGTALNDLEDVDISLLLRDSGDGEMVASNVFSLSAQRPFGRWSATLGGARNDGLSAVDVTANGLVVAGNSDRTSCDVNCNKIMVAQYDRDGAVQWKQILNTDGGDNGSALDVHASSHGTYLVGAQSGWGIVVRLNADGSIDWGRTTKLPGLVSGVASDGDAIYVTGQLTYGNYPYNYDMFVARLDPSTGNPSWYRRFGGTWEDRGVKIAVDGQSVYVVGNTSNTPSGYSDMLTAAFDKQTGAPRWSHTLGNNYIDSGSDLLVANGLVYVVGTAAPTIGGNSGKDAVVAAYSTQGDFQWQKAYRNTYNNPEGFSSIAQTNGRIFVTGHQTGSCGNGRCMLIAELAQDGSLVWKRGVMGKDITRAGTEGVGIAASGSSVQVVGYSNDIWNYGRDGLVLSLDANGPRLGKAELLTISDIAFNPATPDFTNVRDRPALTSSDQLPASLLGPLTITATDGTTLYGRTDAVP